jgi:hypothetical protein
MFSTVTNIAMYNMVHITHLLTQNRNTLNNKQPVGEKAHTNCRGGDGQKTLKPNTKKEQPPLEGIILEIT